MAAIGFYHIYAGLVDFAENLAAGAYWLWYQI